ncbi:MAG TPA: hypothetical protein DD723_09300 [Candidatus Omnitrophica bacterium]|nr:hypothetical protein [Candidatus Omnitrophota bacterium]
MNFLEKIKEIFCSRRMAFLLLASFLVWGFLMRGFILNKSLLIGDAAAYYEHFKFYLDNISRGVYPMWESSREFGVPSEFFLRRIGSFNPLFYLILLFNVLGLSYLSSYLVFLTVYYFLGMLGFFLLAQRVLKDPITAFAAYLLLMFSSLGTRLFDSYIVLTLIPMIWFCYFLISFSLQQEKCYFLGITLTLMILATTYVPFYFLTIVLTFLIFFIILYFKESKILLRRYLSFVQGHKTFAAMCLLALSLSLVPGFLFFQDAGKGEIIIPQRHADSTSENQITVDFKRIQEGGTRPMIVLDDTISNLENFTLGQFYIPIFSLLIIAMGAMAPINKKLILFSAVGFSLFSLSLTDAVPINRFLYDHIFYFKYFRNYDHFLWIGILPIFILICSDLLRLLFAYRPATRIQKYTFFTYLLIVHAGLVLFLYQQDIKPLSSYANLCLSFVFFVYYFSHRQEGKNLPLPLFLFILVLCQPLEVYHYLNHNSLKNPQALADPYRYEGDKPFLRLTLPDDSISHPPFMNQPLHPSSLSQENIERKPTNIYLGTYWYNAFRQNLPKHVVSAYLDRVLIAYDHVEWIDDNTDFERIDRALLDNENTAFISSSDEHRSTDHLRTTKNIPDDVLPHHPYAQIITKNSPEVRVAGFDVNFIKLKTHFHSKKFLVYNDTFHSGWQAFIDGQKVDLWRANIAFKGLWVPQGEHVVYLRFGPVWSYVLNYSLLGIFLFIFLWLLLSSIKLWISNRPKRI